MAVQRRTSTLRLGRFPKQLRPYWEAAITPAPKGALPYDCAYCDQSIFGEEGKDWHWLPSRTRAVHQRCDHPEKSASAEKDNPANSGEPKENTEYRCCMCQKPIEGKEWEDWVWLSVERPAHVGCYTPEE